MEVVDEDTLDERAKLHIQNMQVFELWAIVVEVDLLEQFTEFGHAVLSDHEEAEPVKKFNTSSNPKLLYELIVTQVLQIRRREQWVKNYTIKNRLNSHVDNLRLLRLAQEVFAIVPAVAT